MSELYIMRWPRDLSAVYVNGATINRYKDNIVSYANEVLSPGQTICTWVSSSDYLHSGVSPSLPLLYSNKSYELNINLEADNTQAVQVEINFFDYKHENIKSYRDITFPLEFKVPNGMMSYEIKLINLKHHWIFFDYLSISQIQKEKITIEKQFKQYYDLIRISKLNNATNKKARLVVNKGPRTIIPVAIDTGEELDTIFLYTNGKNLNILIKELSKFLIKNCINKLKIETGLNLYNSPNEIIKQIKEGLGLSEIYQEE